MPYRVLQRSRVESGFTLVELLLAILITAILFSIAIPSLLSQQGNAADAGAEQLARVVKTTAETYVVDHEGTYEGMTAAELKRYEPGIQIVPGNGNAYLSTVTVEPGELGYVVTATATDGHTFSIEKKSSGQVLHGCTPAGKTGSAGGACQKGTW